MCIDKTGYLFIGGNWGNLLSDVDNTHFLAVLKNPIFKNKSDIYRLLKIGNNLNFIFDWTDWIKLIND